MRLIVYTLLTALLTLGAVFAMHWWGARPASLPVVAAPPEIAGASCAQSIVKARELTRRGALDPARLAYLWVIEHCGDSPVLPDALIEAGSLFAHLLQRPAEAQQAYDMFLHRFPTHAGAADATYHLAKIEIDAGDYAAAVANLTRLVQRHPDSAHTESARFLAAKAAELLVANQRSQRTVVGQLAALVPNNIFSLLALLAAIGPAAIQTVRQARNDSAPDRWSRIIPIAIVGLTLVNYLINNVDNARQNERVMEKLENLDKLLNASAYAPEAR